MIFALTTHDIDEVIFHVASVLQVPVLILALLALARVIFELGSYIVEVVGRRARRFHGLLEGADHAWTDEGDRQLNKALADFDFDSQRRLARTRLLVRAGPALGLMGTLIPLSPALTGLANGDTAALSENLRVAFSVTVVGLLIGAVAFGLSLSRDRMYGQDLSNLEYVAAIISDPRPAGGDA